MRHRAIIGALLLIAVGVILGTTVFRSDIAQATGLAQSVTVNNTAANPVPVEAADKTVVVTDFNFVAGQPPRVFDISAYKEIRIAVQEAAGSVCVATDALHLYTDANGTRSAPLATLSGSDFCGAGDGLTETYEVPGVSLELEYVAGFAEGNIRVVIYGRAN